VNNLSIFVKALPLEDELNVDELEQPVENYFHTFNVDLLFTIEAIPCRVNQQLALLLQAQQAAEKQKISTQYIEEVPVKNLVEVKTKQKSIRNN